MNIFQLVSIGTVSFAALLTAGPSVAQVHAGHSTATTPHLSNDLAEGEVRRIDPGTQKITIKHGEIKSMDMPPMTMVFTAAQPALLNNLKVGDKIRFAVDQQAGKMTVTRIEPLR